MWGGGYSLTIIVGAFAAALVAMSFAFAGGAVIVALPLALVGVAVAGVVDVRRRSNQSRNVQELRKEAKAENVDFTDRDKETLVSD